MIDHLVVKLVLLSLSCQMYFDSSVLLESFLWVNVDLCCVDSITSHPLFCNISHLLQLEPHCSTYRKHVYIAS